MILYNSHVSGSLVVDEDVIVSGILYASEKHFYIDHPTKKEKKLVYGVLEGPENAVYIRGKLFNNNIIELPDYWLKLVDLNNLTIMLTPINKFQKLYVKSIINNKIYIKKSIFSLFRKINCYYIVFGERKDISKLQVEINKQDFSQIK